jgi:hypothetical protein
MDRSRVERRVCACVCMHPLHDYLGTPHDRVVVAGQTTNKQTNKQPNNQTKRQMSFELFNTNT